jgi:hypothetical protein
MRLFCILGELGYLEEATIYDHLLTCSNIEVGAVQDDGLLSTNKAL